MSEMAPATPVRVQSLPTCSGVAGSERFVGIELTEDEVRKIAGAGYTETPEWRRNGGAGAQRVHQQHDRLGRAATSHQS